MPFDGSVTSWAKPKKKRATAKEIGLKRLAMLADHLEKNVAIEGFDIDHWDKCACAAGTNIPAFNRLGYEANGAWYEANGAWYEANGAWMGSVPSYKGHSGGDAARAFFHLTQDQSDTLFSSYGYSSYNPRPKTVARHIRKYIATGVA